MSKTPAFHGSDVEKICEYYNIAKDSLVLFGANVNPLGLSSSVKQDICENLDIICQYPDREYTSLRQTIGEYCDVDPNYIITGNGSTELISLLIRQRNGKHALVIGPTYSEYERELSLTNGKVSYYNLKADDNFQLNTEDLFLSFPADMDFLILCNPNNPTSSALTTETIKIILEECRTRNIFVMIDETYVEFAPEISKISAMPLVKSYDNLIVIRGISKFFAAPGLRLGYCATSNLEFLADVKKNQNPWSLNSIAAFAGERLFQDKTYIDQTRALILSERQRMYETLQTYPNIKVFPAYGNFILVKLEKAGLTSSTVFTEAIKKGLMIRDCSTFQALDGEYIRFCIMLPAQNDRLLQCLSELL